MKFRHCRNFVAFLALLAGQGHAEIVPHVKQPGKVFASCTVINGDQEENLIWFFYPHNGELWVGNGGPLGRVVRADNDYLVGRIEIDMGPFPYLGHILIERESSKYYETRIWHECINNECAIQTSTYEGTCFLN